MKLSEIVNEEALAETIYRNFEGNLSPEELLNLKPFLPYATVELWWKNYFTGEGLNFSNFESNYMRILKQIHVVYPEKLPSLVGQLDVVIEKNLETIRDKLAKGGWNLIENRERLRILKDQIERLNKWKQSVGIQPREFILSEQ